MLLELLPVIPEYKSISSWLPQEQIRVSKLYFKAEGRCSALPSLPGRAWGTSLKVNSKFWSESLYLIIYHHHHFVTLRIHSYRVLQLFVQLGQISPGLTNGLQPLLGFVC